MAKLTSKELVDCLFDDNSWVWRQALLLLGERGDGSAAPALKEIIGQSVNEVDALRALWALHACGAANETVLKSLFGHKYPWVRAWAIRLYGQLQHVESWLDEPLKAAVEKEQDIHVLREMASMLQRRLPAEFRTNAAARDWRASLLAALSEKAADKNDPVLLFMTWLAWEPLVGEGSRSGTADPQARLVDLKTKAETAARLAEPIYRRCFRKLASNPDPNAVLGLMKALAAIDDGNIRLQGLEGMLEALRGRRLAVSGAKLMEHGAVLKEHLADPELMRRYQLVALHFGDEGAVAAMEAEAADGRLELARRIEAVQALALARLPQSAAPLLKLAIAGDLRLQAEALRALGSFESPEIPAALTKALPTMPAALRKEAILLLATKRAWAGALLDALKAKAITREELTENDVRRILAFNDKELTERVEAVWGKLRTQTPENIKQMMAKYTDQLRDLPADRAAGKAVFAKTCQTCHKLFGEGHSVGPELTGANRRDPNYLLENILDPNKLVGKEYYAVVVEDKRGVLHTGLLAEDAPDHVTLKAENDKLTTIARKDIEQIKVSDKSLMPEGLPNNVTEKEFRDLIAYLIEDAYLTQGKIAGPFKMALDYAGPIETAADPLKTPGVSWKPFAVGPFGLIDMEKQKVLAPPTDSTAYVLFEVKAPTARKTTLETAADEDLKVWVNGREVFSRPRTFQPVRIEVELKEGVNRLMFKVHNIYGPSWLWARLADPKRELETAPGN